MNKLQWAVKASKLFINWMEIKEITNKYIVYKDNEIAKYEWNTFAMKHNAFIEFMTNHYNGTLIYNEEGFKEWTETKEEKEIYNTGLKLKLVEYKGNNE